MEQASNETGSNGSQLGNCPIPEPFKLVDVEAEKQEIMALGGMIKKGRRLLDLEEIIRAYDRREDAWRNSGVYRVAGLTEKNAGKIKSLISQEPEGVEVDVDLRDLEKPNAVTTTVEPIFMAEEIAAIQASIDRMHVDYSELREEKVRAGRRKKGAALLKSAFSTMIVGPFVGLSRIPESLITGFSPKPRMLREYRQARQNDLNRARETLQDDLAIIAADTTVAKEYIQNHYGVPGKNMRLKVFDEVSVRQLVADCLTNTESEHFKAIMAIKRERAEAVVRKFLENVNNIQTSVVYSENIHDLMGDIDYNESFVHSSHVTYLKRKEEFTNKLKDLPGRVWHFIKHRFGISAPVEVGQIDGGDKEDVLEIRGLSKTENWLRRHFGKKIPPFVSRPIKYEVEPIWKKETVEVDGLGQKLNFFVGEEGVFKAALQDIDSVKRVAAKTDVRKLWENQWARNLHLFVRRAGQAAAVVVAGMTLAGHGIDKSARTYSAGARAKASALAENRPYEIDETWGRKLDEDIETANKKEVGVETAKKDPQAFPKAGHNIGKKVVIAKTGEITGKTVTPRRPADSRPASADTSAMSTEKDRISKELDLDRELTAKELGEARNHLANQMAAFERRYHVAFVAVKVDIPENLLMGFNGDTNEFKRMMRKLGSQAGELKTIGHVTAANQLAKVVDGKLRYMEYYYSVRINIADAVSNAKSALNLFSSLKGKPAKFSVRRTISSHTGANDSSSVVVEESFDLNDIQANLEKIIYATGIGRDRELSTEQARYHALDAAYYLKLIPWLNWQLKNGKNISYQAVGSN